MREGWTATTLGSACQIKPPKKEAKERLNLNDMVSFVPMSNLGIGTKLIGLDEDRPLAKVAGSYTYFAENDVLLAKITPCFENGKLGIARGLTNGVGFGSSEYIVFRPKDELSQEYLYYFLSQDSFKAAGARVMSGAVGHKRVPKEFIDTYSLPLPPLPEQKRIVAILDEAFAGIATAVANAEKNLTNARKLFESHLNALEYPRQPLGDLVEVRTGKLNVNAAVEDGEYPFFTCSRDVYRIDNYAFDCEAILLAGNNASGDFNVKHYEGKFNAYQRTYVITVNEEQRILYRYLYFQLLKSLKELKKSSVGTGTKFLKLAMIKGLRIGLPPVDIQVSILRVLEEIKTQSESLETIYQQKLDSLADLKQSILQKAFAGELTAKPDKVLAEAGL